MVVPARRLSRPIWLVMSLTELVPTIGERRGAAEVKESTLVFE